jgi:serine phosphatase RsbU (regulator of sigma subunit)
MTVGPSPKQEIHNMRQIIRNLPFFASLPDNEIDHLAGVLRKRDYSEGALLFKEGEPGGRFSLIVQGQIEIFKILDESQERLLSLLGPGDTFGEMSLLDEGGLRTASARARTDVHLLEMERDDFDSLMRRHPVLSNWLLKEMLVRLRNAQDAVIEDLKERNLQLSQALEELTAAQAQLILKEKMEHELKLARQIQENILPKTPPQAPGWHIEARWLPAREVSGDFYDYLPFSDRQVGVILGDVTGKGMPAALVMSVTRSILRTVAEQLISPGVVLERVNDLLCREMPPKMFVTCLYILVDMVKGDLRIANAGHPLPFVVFQKEVKEIRATGMPLGLMEGMDYPEKQARLSRGNFMVMYSDGLIEGHNSEGEMFGTPRLRTFLANGPWGNRLIEAILGEFQAFGCVGGEQEDDVTLVTLERL